MSDHFSGPRAIADPAADITDFYAFPSPEQAGRLVMVMNIFPMAAPGALFSDALAYRFRLRPLTVKHDGGKPACQVGEHEFTFACTFDAPHQPLVSAELVQTGSCTTPSGETVLLRVNDEQGTEEEGLRLFAGLRLDPFFVDLISIRATNQMRHIAFKPNAQNSLAGQNVLSIVIEADVATHFGTGVGPLFAVAGEIMTTSKHPVRLERIGRPEIKNVVMSAKEFDPVNRNLEVRDLYNQEDPFRLSTEYAAVYRARLNANLAFFDTLDDKIDWPLDEQGNHPLTDLFVADFLGVDISKPYHEASCFEIEQALLHGRTPTTCGGRSLNDDIISSLYTLLVNGGNGPRIEHGVAHATQPATRSFPYLVRPNPNPPDIKAKAATLLATPKGGAS